MSRYQEQQRVATRYPPTMTSPVTSWSDTGSDSCSEPCAERSSREPQGGCLEGDAYLQYRELFLTKLALEVAAALATFLVTAAAIMMMLLQQQGLLTAVIVIALSVPAFVLATQRLSRLAGNVVMPTHRPAGEASL